MRELFQTIPDVNILLALEPEELGAKLLFLLRKCRDRHDGMFHPSSLIAEVVNPVSGDGGYPANKRPMILEALAEAWAWLEAQGLVIQDAEGGVHGWRRLSRRARKFENETQFADFATAQLLPKALLHPAISEKAWLAFARGDYDQAVFLSMKQVEIAVRKACGYGDDAIGVALVRNAFDLEKGPLTDMSALKAEREARQHLFAGAIGSYKNPQSHREVNEEDPTVAVELIMLGSHLLRIVDARIEAKLTAAKAPQAE